VSKPGGDESGGYAGTGTTPGREGSSPGESLRGAADLRARCVSLDNREECSEALGRSVDTLRGEWAFVKSWLQRELRKDET
jgi:hypothetical protein